MIPSVQRGEIVDAQYSFIIKKNSNKQTNEHS